MSSSSPNFAKIFNGGSLPLNKIPRLREGEFFSAIESSVSRGSRIISYFGVADSVKGPPDLWIILGDDNTGLLEIAYTSLSRNEFPSITPKIPQAHLFEREIYEQFGAIPEGHPWLKPVRFPSHSMSTESQLRTPQPVIGVTRYFTLHGEEVHEVGVGPVHAGVIEPGHFRFQCFGEQVLHLEISLGYQHRGVEEALLGGPFKHSISQMETIAGDTSVGHSWAFAMNIEALTGMRAHPRAEVIRAVALELERLANHTGDLGALAGDVGFLPTLSFCGRLRGDFLNMTALVCGNRFGRSLVVPGGVRVDLDSETIAELQKRLSKSYLDVEGAVELIWETSSVCGRFENTGTVTDVQGSEVGLVGVAARACGVERDVRYQYPWGPYRFCAIPPAIVPGGDVNSRALVRRMEIQHSKEFIDSSLENLPSGEILAMSGSHHKKALATEQISVALTEGWRGEVCHVAMTDTDGRFKRYKVTDPSFHNWFGLALALRGQQISDFPLCNKSFNLSYCGYDL